jgi:hypothetical protein
VPPTIYEVFTWPWLAELSARVGRPVDLGNVPDEAWDELALPGADTIWLMGVWARSDAGRRVALTDPGFRAATVGALPDATRADVVGSPYCIRDYTVDPRLGGRDGLATARAALAERGLRLLLDFVPNHVAPDHSWVSERPEYFVKGTPADVEDDPAAWLETEGGVYARGRDPYFPPWPDVLQLDLMSPGLREAAIATLRDIAAQCDGVRCDMAMLCLDDVAERTWHHRLQPPRESPYWRQVTEAVRQTHPDFLFVAEAYWDREQTLLEQGIDYCYDKRLYDRLADGDAGSIRDHLSADVAWQERLVRFLENHDEPRAATVFPRDRLRAAVVALLTLPGAILLHEGQLDALETRLPVHLGRRPAEPPDAESRSFWSHTLATVANEHVREGEWRLLDVTGWPDNQSCDGLVAWRWRNHLVVINYSGVAADGLVQLGADAAGRTWPLHDVFDGRIYERDGDELASCGLYVSLPSFGVHLFRFG